MMHVNAKPDVAALKIFLADIAVIVACIVALEILLRVFFPQPLQKMLRHVYEPSLTTSGYLFKQSVATVCNNGFGDHVFSINSWRCRDQEYGQKKAGEWRILVVGDSFSENQALPVEKIYANILEERLKAKHPGSLFTVVNAGMAGWGLWDFHDYLRDWLPVIEPDVVVIAVSTSSKILSSPLPSAPRKKKILAGLPVNADASPADRIAWAAWFLNQQLECYSHAFIAFRRSTNFIFEWLRVGKTPSFSPLVKYPAVFKKFFEPTAAVVRNIKLLCDDRHTAFALLHVPAWYECMADQQWLKIQIERPEVYNLDVQRPSRLIKKIAKAVGAPLYDPTEDLSRSSKPPYFPVFWHWNETGNRIVAEGLEKFLEEQNLLGPAKATTLTGLCAQRR